MVVVRDGTRRGPPRFSWRSSHATVPASVSAGARQPCRSQARRNGLKTRKGCRPPSRRGRARRHTATRCAPACARRRPAPSRRPRRACGRRGRSRRRCAQWARRRRRRCAAPRRWGHRAPRGADRRGSRRVAEAAVEHGPPGAWWLEQRRVQQTARPCRAASAAARRVGWSCTRRSRRNQTTVVLSGAGWSLMGNASQPRPTPPADGPDGARRAERCSESGFRCVQYTQSHFRYQVGPPSGPRQRWATATYSRSVGPT